MMRIFQVLLLFALVGHLSVVRGQDKEHQFVGLIGLASGVLDNGIGLNLGFSANRPLSRMFSLEGQMSYSKVGVKAFLSGEKQTISALTLMAGGRLYLLRPEKNVRPYLNLLIGGAYTNERRVADITTSTDYASIGISTGLYMEIKRKLILGLAVESPGFFILRGGYSF